MLPLPPTSIRRQTYSRNPLRRMCPLAHPTREGATHPPTSGAMHRLAVTYRDEVCT